MRYVLILAAVLSLLGCTKHDPGTTLSSLERLQGQWVVVNYWAQWCAPCIKEIPELNRLDQDYTGVTVVGVNYDGTNGEELELQRQKLGVTFASLESDPAAQLGIPRPVVLPTTLDSRSNRATRRNTDWATDSRLTGTSDPARFEQSVELE